MQERREVVAMKVIESSYIVISRSDQPVQPQPKTGSWITLCFSLFLFFWVAGAVAISEDPWAFWNEFVLIVGYIALSGGVLVVAVWIRAALRG